MEQIAKFSLLVGPTIKYFSTQISQFEDEIKVLESQDLRVLFKRIFLGRTYKGISPIERIPYLKILLNRNDFPCNQVIDFLQDQVFKSDHHKIIRGLGIIFPMTDKIFLDKVKGLNDLDLEKRVQLLFDMGYNPSKEVRLFLNII